MPLFLDASIIVLRKGEFWLKKAVNFYLPSLRITLIKRAN